MKVNRRVIVKASAAFTLPSFTLGASAANWPAKSVRLFVPFPPGGGVDVSTRMLAEQLSIMWGQGKNVIVDNKPGANTIIAASAALSAPKDDHNFLASINLTRQLKYLGQKIPFDAQADLIPVGAITVEQLVLVVNASSGVNAFEEFTNWARKKNAGLNFGTFALGSLAHLTALQIAKQLDLKITPVHYRGSAPAVQALLSGEIDITLSNLGTVQQHISAGKLTPLTVTGSKRYRFAPKLPTMGEVGVTGLEFISWVGVFAPVGTSHSVVTSMSTEMQKALQNKDLINKFNSFYQEPGQFSLEEFQELIRQDDFMAQKLIKDHNVRLE
jgi:tripartite-type tricarboxylate transporter receptor subunit TctC